ncbi:helix-turn-helix domain-containing protein [Dyadobacter sp. CY312]|uniref:helix-turn-helix domain-containing protein n=1 Tax=Dyadobacter sp. CY312 TaxID=2907303 RepID=UPI001F2A6D38|nr:helix-turn-helix domain-containing protein [Dyadobacter sp. CY312]MCE7039288.1 helix-turn-helix domain-containing protein [Dyadobacter sp. CY312]
MEIDLVRKIVAEEVAKYNDVYLSVEEAMELLKSTSKKSFYEQSKKFTRYKPLGRIIFKKSEIIEHIERHKVEPLPSSLEKVSTQRQPRIIFTSSKSSRK